MLLIRQFSKYSTTAIASAAGDWCWFSILIVLGASPLLAQMSARLVGGLISFAMNRHWSFHGHQEGSIILHGRRFLLLYAASYALSLTIFVTLNLGVGIMAYPAKLIADITCFLFNFSVMRLYVFHDRHGLVSLARSFFNRIGKTT